MPSWGLSRAEMVRNTCFQSNIVSVTYGQSEDSLILSIMSTFKMILSDRGLDRRIQEMGLGKNMIQGILS